MRAGCRLVRQRQTQDGSRQTERCAASNQHVLHVDNGGSMGSATVFATLPKSGIAPPLSCPTVSNDTPYSEADFRALKYVTANWQAFCQIGWGQAPALRRVIPAPRHAGDDHVILQARKAMYERLPGVGTPSAGAAAPCATGPRLTSSG